MAVTQTSETCNYTLPPLTTSNLRWTLPEMRSSYQPWKWIDEDLYRTTILQLYPTTTESEFDENLQRDALDLGLSPIHTSPQAATMASSIFTPTVNSDAQHGSIMSQSTAPTSCDSSERRPSTSLSNKSSKRISSFEIPMAATEMERKRHYGLRDGFRKMTTFRRKRMSGMSTPSMASMRSSMTGTTTNESTTSPQEAPLSLNSGDSCSSHDSPVVGVSSGIAPAVDQKALQRSMECEKLMHLQTQQLDEKRRFLEYQTKLISQLLATREEAKSKKKDDYKQKIEEQEEKVSTLGFSPHISLANNHRMRRLLKISKLGSLKKK